MGSIKMKSLMTLLCLLALCPFTVADTEDSEQPELLQQLALRAQNLSQLEGQFNQQKVLSALPKPIKSSGQFHFHRSTGIVWRTQKPIDSKVEISKLGIFAEGEVIGNRYSDVIASIFMALISGQLTQLDNYFDIQARGKLDAWQLQLTPKYSALAREIQRIEIHGSQYTDAITLFEGADNRTEIRLSQVTGQTRVRAGSEP